MQGVERCTASCCKQDRERKENRSVQSNPVARVGRRRVTWRAFSTTYTRCRLLMTSFSRTYNTEPGVCCWGGYKQWSPGLSSTWPDNASTWRGQTCFRVRVLLSGYWTLVGMEPNKVDVQGKL